jgi:hypothetical protein
LIAERVAEPRLKCPDWHQILGRARITSSTRCVSRQGGRGRISQAACLIEPNLLRHLEPDEAPKVGLSHPGLRESKKPREARNLLRRAEREHWRSSTGRKRAEQVDVLGREIEPMEALDVADGPAALRRVEGERPVYDDQVPIRRESLRHAGLAATHLVMNSMRRAIGSRIDGADGLVLGAWSHEKLLRKQDAGSARDDTLHNDGPPVRALRVYYDAADTIASKSSAHDLVALAYHKPRFDTADAVDED